ncbi:MAG: hypothetical protein HYV07_00060 [Deltaproteobacteria bacterium]|nr:hypothetical protein [Deltaproteobacteria bacterium]
MLETLGGMDAVDEYASDRLSTYSWHTGGRVEPLDPDEPCPLLFRDLGPRPTLTFLTGRLRRLAGPMSPLLYLRTERWQEPYTDHSGCGRLVFLRPLLVRPWRSGVPFVFVARGSADLDRSALGWVPSGVGLDRAADLLSAVANVDELREALGGRDYDAAREAAAAGLVELISQEDESERALGPLRAAHRSSHAQTRLRAETELFALGLSEHDLNDSWGHLAPDDRDRILERVRGWGRRGE